MSLTSLSRRRPVTFKGRAMAKAVMEIRMGRSTGRTFRMAEIKRRLKAIRPPKIQLPTASSQGVTLSSRLARALKVCRDCSAGSRGRGFGDTFLLLSSGVSEGIAAFGLPFQIVGVALEYGPKIG